MSYPLINGATINGAEGGLQLGDLDLVVGGQPTALAVVNVGAGAVTELGGMSLTFALAPTGLDVVVTEPHTGLFNAMLRPDGVDTALAGLPIALLTADAAGDQPMELGGHRAKTGTDYALSVDGRDLVRQGFHSALAGQPLPAVAVEAAGSRPLELGKPVIARSAEQVDVAGASPLACGALQLSLTLPAAGYAPAEVGGIAMAFATQAESDRPTQYGAVTLGFLLAPPGSDLARHGSHAVALGDSYAEVSGAIAAELGMPGAPAFTFQARPMFPLQLGRGAISRGASC